MPRRRGHQRSRRPSTSQRQGRFVAFLLASATALLVAAPTFWEFLWPLTWVAFVPLVVALRHASCRRAFLLGWWAETLMIWLGFSWLIGTMVRFGYIAVPMSILFFAVIGIGNGVRLGLFTWWFRYTDRLNESWWYRLFLPGCIYVALDYLFPRVFPWYLGFMQFPAKPLIQIADITGIHGITFLLLTCNIVGASFWPHPDRPAGQTRRLMGLVLAGLLLLNTGYGVWRLSQVTTTLQQASTLRVALIQPNIDIELKRSGMDRQERLRLQVEMSRPLLAQRPDLIIWPETMYPFAVPTNAEHLLLPPVPENRQTYWLLGALTYGRQHTTPQVFNSALLVAPDRRIVGRYDKQQLLAFGEYIPLQRYVPFLRHISPTIGNLTRGSGGLVTLPNGVGIGGLICYEDILPSLSRQAVRQGAQLLVNLTNDAWFGRTRAPYLHRSLAAFRAIENRVYLIRATNTGLTSIIDPLGHEHARLPIYQRDVLIHTIQPLRLSTLYTRLGDWFAQLCSLAAILLPLGCWRRLRSVRGIEPFPLPQRRKGERWGRTK